MALSRREIVAASLVLLDRAPAQQQQQRKRVILMLGPPGSGKTTQSERLRSALGLPIVSMAAILKAEGGGKGGLNKNLKAQIATGDMVSDEVANGLMQKRIARKDCERGFIVDGYPFTAKQAEYFDALLGDLGLPAPTVIHLSLAEPEAGRRLTQRGRAEDSPANIERRLAEYRREADLLLGRYRNAVTVDGAQSPDAVAAAIRKALAY